MTDGSDDLAVPEGPVNENGIFEGRPHALSALL